MEDVVIPLDNGPLQIDGSIRLAWPSGRELAAGEQTFLCRCGFSLDKPFCDGSHTKAGFRSQEGDETAHHD